MDLKQKKIAFISLGCDKNKVDLEEMMHNLSKFGFSFANSSKAQIVIINTCAFILSARKEAIDNILEMAKQRWNAKLNKDWKTADLLRDEIVKKGYKILDSKDGYEVVK